jgi:hypothetical protein
VRAAVLHEHGAAGVRRIRRPGRDAWAGRRRDRGGGAARRAGAAGSRDRRHVEVGQLAGTEIALPAPLIRSVSLAVRGFSIAHPPLELRREAFAQLCDNVGTGQIPVDVERVPLADVPTAGERHRAAADGPKLVLLHRAEERTRT